MGLPLKWILPLLLLLQAWRTTNGQKEKFPTMDDLFLESYEAEVQITDTNENGTAFVTEYYDDTDVNGRIDLLMNGKRVSIFYFRENGDIVEITESGCDTKTIKDSMYSQQAIYYGWLNQEPFVIGPSALLWFVNDKKEEKTVVYKNNATIRGIKCDWYQLKVDKKDIQMTYDYYFADSSWISPNGKNEKRIPIRITVNGYTSEYMPGSLVPINQIVDFAYFWPYLSDFTKLMPPIGIGCPGRESSSYLPKIPDEFVFFEEELDLLSASNHEDIFVNYNGLFFDARRQLARIDTYKRTGLTQTLYDFNTGVAYVIEDHISCKIKPLAHSIFENEGSDVYQGNMKSAKQVMGLTGDFYYLGTRTYRGIEVDVFEKAELNTDYKVNFGNYLKVVTAFFTSTMTKAVNNAEEMVYVPVYFLDTIYDKPNNIAFQKQFNVFGFDDVVGPVMYEHFPIETCFPLSQQKSFFILVLNEGTELAEQIEDNNQQFIAAIKSEIMRVAGVSDLRIPFLKVNYLGPQTYVTVLLLDRPPALQQFILGFTGPVSASPKMKIIFDAKTPEACAHACVDDAKCGAFHFCGEKAPSTGGCFLNTQSLFTPSEKVEDFDNCYVYFRAEMNSNNKEEYLGKAVEKLDTAVKSGDGFKIHVVLSDILTVELTVASVIFGGLFDETSTHSDYDLVYSGFQLAPTTESQVVLEKEYANTELECYRSCKLEESMNCETFSYCAVGDKKQCRLSPTFYTSEMKKSDDIKNNKNCNVYSLKYLEFYDKNPGKVFMGKGDAVFERVTYPEECAMKCKKEEDLPCRGFDFCKSEQTCILHKTHISDVHPSQIADTRTTKCVHYAAKFTADYKNLGHTIIDDESGRQEAVTVEQCARSCSEDNPSCKSFVYCAGVSTEDSTCFPTKLTLVSTGVKLKEDPKCFLYSKKDGIKDWVSKKAALKPQSNGYSKSGFTGVVIGTLIFGLVVGVLGFMGYSYYRSRRPTDGMTVRFMKQQNA